MGLIPHHTFRTVERQDDGTWRIVHNAVEINFDKDEPVGTHITKTVDGTRSFGHEIEALKAYMLPLLDTVDHYSIHIMRGVDGIIRIDLTDLPSPPIVAGLDLPE